MKEQIKQAIVKALISSYGMTEEEAEEHVLDWEEDELFSWEQEEFGLDGIGFEVFDLSQTGHSYNLTVSYASDYFFAMLQFEEQPNVEAVQAAFDKYEESPVSEELYIENAIEDEGDALVLCFDLQGDCAQALTRLFELLRSESCIQLLDAVLHQEEN